MLYGLWGRWTVAEFEGEGSWGVGFDGMSVAFALCVWFGGIEGLWDFRKYIESDWVGVGCDLEVCGSVRDEVADKE